MITEPNPDSDPGADLDLDPQVLSTHPPICDCEGCRMASPVVSRTTQQFAVDQAARFAVLSHTNDNKTKLILN